MFVRGDRQSIGGVFSQWEMIRSFAQEVIEEHPPRTGPSTRVRSLSDKYLEGHTRTLFRTLQWSGIASADFIRNEAGCLRSDGSESASMGLYRGS